MQKHKKKPKLRWDRVGLLVIALVIIIGGPFWLYNALFTHLNDANSISNSVDGQTKYKPIKGQDGIYRIEGTVIVNKKYGLPQSYNPGVNMEAKAQVEKMIADMRGNHLPVSLDYVGYRSFEEQKELYEQYINENGKEKADTFSARPGFSEHQTGLAFDIIDSSGELLLEKNHPDATSWLADNAHNYGFIIRYIEEKEAITGYMHEEWHIRYLGSDLATKVYDSKKSLEEYFNIEGGSYE